MTILGILHKFILGPIELLLDMIFSLSLQMTGNHFLSIVALSLLVNLLILPLYLLSFKSVCTTNLTD